MPPHIVHIIYALGTGGLENGLVNIINRCDPERYRHTIICITRAEGFAERIAAPNVRVIEIYKRDGHDFSAYWRLWRVLAELRPDIIHSRNIAALEMQLIGLFLLRSPVIARIHGEHGRDTYDLFGTNSRHIFLRKLMRPFIHRFIAVSKDLESWLEKTICVHPDKLRQIYNGVDQERFRRIEKGQIATPKTGIPADFLKEETVVIGTVGRLAAVKDQANLIEAFARLSGESACENLSLRLMLVGDGPLREELESMACRLGVSDVTWFAGDQDDVPSLLASMDVFVLPSIAEGISNTVLEAMACGLPIVATQVGGNPELVRQRENGLLVPAGDPDSLCSALLTLMVDEKLRCEMGRAGLRFVTENFDWTRTVESYLAVYDEVLNLVGRRA